MGRQLWDYTSGVVGSVDGFFFKPTIYSFAQSLSNVPHPLASVNGIVPSVIAGVRGMVELPPFEGFAEINFGNVSHFVGIDHT